MAYKLLRFADEVTDRLILLVCLFLMLLGAYTAYDAYTVFNGADVQATMRFKPDGVEDTAFLTTLEGSVAWLTLDNGHVDYPVMQGEDNSEYLNKDPNGEFSLSGSLFLDSRNAADFSDQYSLIYGHHMQNYSMFGSLDQYLDEKFFNEHTQGTLIVGDTAYELHIFALVEAESWTPEIFSVNEGYDVLSYAKEHHTYYREPDGTQILALSTCKYPDTLERTVLLAAMHPVSGN